MKKQRVTEKGSTWMYYPAQRQTDRAMIVAIGDSDHDLMVRGAAKYFTQLDCDVLAICPTQFEKKYTGYHNFPLEHIECAIKWLEENGHQKIGIAGGSTTGMLALIAASYISSLSLVLAYSPSDFVMQGFYRGKKNGHIPEWPATGQSTVSYQGKPIPYSPFNLDDEAYYNVTFGKSTKEAGEINSLLLFEHVEKQPEFERGFIQIERIKAVVHAFGADDDTLWETTKYIKRAKERLKGKETTCKFYTHCYERGTHFVFPQGLLEAMLPFDVNFIIGKFFKVAKAFPKECEKVRREIDRITTEAIKNW